MAAAYFTRLGVAGLVPQPSCGGAWNTEELHISPVNGVLIHEMERWLARHAPEPRPMTRLSFDYLRVVDFTECSVEVAVLRGGRSVELVEGVLSQHGRPVLRCRAWRMVEHDSVAVAGGTHAPLPGPDGLATHDLTSAWPGGYIASIDMRVVDGPHPGRATAWISTPLEIVAGEPVTDFARLVLVADTANGIGVRVSPLEWQFPNVDLTIHLFRQPRGPWTGLDTRVVFGERGHGLTSTDLYDQDGHVGHAEQSLLIRRR